MKKHKEYIFSYEELILLRESCIEYSFIMPKENEKQKCLNALIEQFKTDIRLF